MKKLFLILILPIILISYSRIAKAEFIRTKIAVLDFMLQGKGFETEDLGQIVAEWLITALVKEGHFDVVERRLLKKIIAEQQLSETGLLDQETTAQLGKVLGVKVIVSGSVMRVQDITEVNARIIDVESGSILAAESVKNADDSQLENLIEQMAQKIIEDFPLEGYIVSRQKGRVIIDLGRLSGVKQGMKFIAYKEGEAIKHPITGEVLGVHKIQTGFIDIRKVLDKLSEGYIIKETEPNAIKYGHLVKSTSNDMKVKKGALFIDVVPADSVIRILNIKPKYYRGIDLAPGKYHIEVTASSYQPKSKWINILPGEKKNMSIALVEEESPMGDTPPEKPPIDGPPPANPPATNLLGGRHLIKPGRIQEGDTYTTKDGTTYVYTNGQSVKVNDSTDDNPFDDNYNSRNQLMTIKEQDRQRDTVAQNIADANLNPNRGKFSSKSLDKHLDERQKFVNAECNDRKPCPDGHTCEDGKCVDKHDDCRKNEDCPKDHECKDGQCIKISDAKPKSLTISPVNKAVKINESVTLKAILKLEDGSTKDVTQEATWNPENPFSKGDIGQYTIKATFKDLSGSAMITVVKEKGIDDITVNPNPATGWKD